MSTEPTAVADKPRLTKREPYGYQLLDGEDVVLYGVCKMPPSRLQPHHLGLEHLALLRTEPSADEHGQTHVTIYQFQEWTDEGWRTTRKLTVTCRHLGPGKMQGSEIRRRLCATFRDLDAPSL